MNPGKHRVGLTLLDWPENLDVVNILEGRQCFRHLQGERLYPTTSDKIRIFEDLQL